MPAGPTTPEEPVLDLRDAPSLQNWRPLELGTAGSMRARSVVDCGWGRLIFAHTFEQPEELVAELRREEAGERDIAFYLRDPHVILSLAPHELFLDPSHTYRLPLHARSAPETTPESASGLEIRRVERREEAIAVHDIALKRRQVPVDPSFLWERRAEDVRFWLVAVDTRGNVVGSVQGIDHLHAFRDPENGSSLWSLAVDPQSSFPGVGRALTVGLARDFARRGRSFLDLSVMHDNAQAIALYEQLGFQRVPAFCVKTKSPINEHLFLGAGEIEGLNPYARIIVDEARRRGIAVDVLDAEAGYFELRSGARSIVCRESLSELTSAVAMSRCDDKLVTSRLLSRAGLRVPEQVLVESDEDALELLARKRRVVVKPSRGEQGAGITVDVRLRRDLARAIERARGYGSRVLVEELVEGQDLRVIVIGSEVVAAAVRKPARIVGTGRHSVRELIEKQSRRRAAATGGESRIPIDEETERCLADAGLVLDEVLEVSREVVVRKTANLHTGGTIHDVTDSIHPSLRKVSVAAARAIGIPVTGLDLIVPRLDGEEYWIIEANERPGLANHEPRPTAGAFVDLLFPETRTPHSPRRS